MSEPKERIFSIRNRQRGAADKVFCFQCLAGSLMMANMGCCRWVNLSLKWGIPLFLWDGSCWDNVCNEIPMLDEPGKMFWWLQSQFWSWTLQQMWISEQVALFTRVKLCLKWNICVTEPELMVLCFPTCLLLALKRIHRIKIREGMEKKAPLPKSLFYVHIFLCVT